MSTAGWLADGTWHVESPVYVVIRCVQYGAFSMLAGGTLAVCGVATWQRSDAGLDTLRARLTASLPRVLVAALGGLLLTLLARVYAQARVFADGVALDPATMRAVVMHTLWGVGWRLEALMLVAGGAALLLHTRWPAVARCALSGVVMGCAVAFAFSGHAVSVDG
jgi:putative copper export protein